jgi:hypothetical protein
MGKSGFLNGDGDCQSDGQARDFEQFSSVPTWGIWVPKWGDLCSQMRIAIATPTDRHETLGCFLGSKIGKSGVPNGDHFVPSWRSMFTFEPCGLTVGPVG